MYTPEEEIKVEAIAERSASKAIEGFFLRLGVDVSDADAVISMQRDFAHLRSWRESIDLVRRKGLAASVTVIASGILGAIWIAIKGAKGL